MDKIPWKARFESSSQCWTIRRQDGAGGVLVTPFLVVDAPCTSRGETLYLNATCRTPQPTMATNGRVEVHRAVLTRYDEDRIPGKLPGYDPMIDWSLLYNKDSRYWVLWRSGTNGMGVVETPELRLDTRVSFRARQGCCHAELLLDGTTYKGDSAEISRAIHYAKLRTLKVYNQIVPVGVMGITRTKVLRPGRN